MKKSVKTMVLTAMLTALYFVLSISLKIPTVGNISLDLGYIALTIAAVYLGALPAAIVGGLGAAIESTLLSPYGLSIGWVVMNICIGIACGTFLFHRHFDKPSKLYKAVFVILVSVFAGVLAKTVIECLLYSIPILVKIPKSASAFFIDSFVMIFAGLPLSVALEGRIK